MTKKVLIAILAVLLIVVGLTSCNDGSSGGKTDPKRPATLELRNFKESYRLNDSKSALQGTLLYTNTNGTINTVDVKDSAVTVTGFDTSKEGTGNIVKFTYQGIDCAGTYGVYNIPSVLDAEGCFVVDDLTTYDFTANSNKVVVEKYASWAAYENVTPIEPSPSPLNYEVKISSNGLVYALVGDKRFYPDGIGGFKSYESNYVAQPEYGTGCYYVSTEAEKASHTHTIAQNKYLVVQFTTDYTMKMWFVADKPTSAPTGDPNYVIPAASILFGTSGIYVKDIQIGEGDNLSKNLCVYSRNNYEDSLIVVSKTDMTDDNYKGYFYTLKFKEFPS